MRRVLFDHCVSRKFAKHLPGHDVTTARAMGWDDLSNGLLLAAAAGAAIDAFITVDKNLRHQQNAAKMPLAVIVIDSVDNDVQALEPYAPDVLGLLAQRLECKVYVLPRKPTGPAKA